MDALKKIGELSSKCIKNGILMLAGVGVIHIGQLLHWWNFTVNSMEISPAQAEAVQKHLEYGVESDDRGSVINPPKRKK